MNIVPAIDMKDGRCVRLYQGMFDQQTEYSDDPPAVATRFAAMGFSSLHLVDLDGAQSGRQKHRTLVQQMLTTTNFDIQLGGGIRDAATVKAWLDTGISRCVLGSVAVTDVASVRTWFDTFGADNIVLALDVRLDANDLPFLSTHGWTEAADKTLWQGVDDYLDVGLQHVLCTDISRDGAMSGPNIRLYKEFMQRYPGVNLQASGGVRNIDDLQRLRDSGVAAAITGRALLDGQITKAEIASFQRGA